PVFTWKQGNDLLVLGYPKNSYSKFMTNYLPLSAIQKTPFLLLNMLVSTVMEKMDFKDVIIKNFNKN
ncbi:hypothetical protein ACTPEM_22630, partial [Clostridioides difficile]